MSNVEFDNDQMGGLSGYPGTPRRASAMARPEGSALSRFFIRIGFASDEKGAQRVMLGIAVIALCVMGYFMYQLLFAHKAQIPPTMPPFLPH